MWQDSVPVNPAATQSTFPQSNTNLPQVNESDIPDRIIETDVQQLCIPRVQVPGPADIGMNHESNPANLLPDLDMLAGWGIAAGWFNPAELNDQADPNDCDNPL